MSIDHLFPGGPAPSPGQQPQPAAQPGYPPQPAAQPQPGYPPQAPVQQGQFAAQPQHALPPQGYAQPQPGYATQPQHALPPQGYAQPQPGYATQPQQANPAWADAVAGATASQNGAPYLHAGNYVLDILRVKAKPKRENPAETVFIIEGTVIESSNPDAVVGSERSVMRTLPGPNGQGASDVRGWIEAIVGGAAAARGQAPPVYEPTWLHSIVSDAQPLAGQRIKVTAWDKENAKGTIDPKTGRVRVFTMVRVEYLPPGTVLGLVAQAPAPQAPAVAPGQFAAQPPAQLPPPQHAPAPAQPGYPQPGQQPAAPAQVQYAQQPPPGWPAHVPYPPQG